MTENTKELQRVVIEGLYNTFRNPEGIWEYGGHTSLSSNILGRNMRIVTTDFHLTADRGVAVNTEEGQEKNTPRFFKNLLKHHDMEMYEGVGL